MKSSLSLLLVFVLSCSGTQDTTRSWETDVQAGLVLTAHTIDGADQLLARSYTAAHDDGGTTATLDARYAGINLARHLARPALQAAQSSVTAAMRIINDAHSTAAQKASAECQLLSALHESRDVLTHLGEAFDVAGIPGESLIASGVNALVPIIAAGPLCPVATATVSPTLDQQLDTLLVQRRVMDTKIDALTTVVVERETKRLNAAYICWMNDGATL